MLFFVVQAFHLLSPQAALLGQLRNNQVIKFLPLLCMRMRSLDLQQEEQVMMHEIFVVSYFYGVNMSLAFFGCMSRVIKFFELKISFFLLSSKLCKCLFCHSVCLNVVDHVIFLIIII